MASRGAQLVDVDDGAFPAETDVSVIRYEFKFDLDDYLRRTPTAPVRSLADILRRHLVLPALETAFARSNDVTTLDTDEYRAARRRQDDLRTRVITLLDEHRVSALAYPTLRRTAAKIGEPQTGGNCAASAATGLPAITVPAGFADDGMPVGLELLGRPFAEAGLLRMAYAFEQATHHRRRSALVP